MAMIITESIPAEKIQDFHAILCATGGRYLGNPFMSGGIVRVQYEPGDYVAHCEAWARCVTPLRETRRDQWWRVALRRVKGWLT